QQGYTYTFRPGNTANTNTDALLGICDLIEAKFGDKIENAAILYANGEWGVSQSESFKELFSKAGINVVFNETFEAGTSDFSSIITKLKNSGAQVMIPVLDNFSDAVLFARQMKEYKANIAILACGGVFVLQEFIDTLGADANLIFSTDVWNADFLPMRGEEAVALHQGYIDQYGHKMGEQAGMAWVAAVTLLEGMKNAASTKGSDIKDALLAQDLKPGDEAMMMIPYEGIKMNEETADGQFGQNIYAFSMASQVINGEWRAVFPDSILQNNPITWPIVTE
ncbi:MAG: ABC transporter substrate-binding protein, partial [Christensenellaceae bacterium]|nr:ABC transporter substrate-binding protein [Christensenellaceae bacterium]